MLNVSLTSSWKYWNGAGQSSDEDRPVRVWAGPRGGAGHAARLRRGGSQAIVQRASAYRQAAPPNTPTRSQHCALKAVSGPEMGVDPVGGAPGQSCRQGSHIRPSMESRPGSGLPCAGRWDQRDCWGSCQLVTLLSSHLSPAVRPEESSRAGCLSPGPADTQSKCQS